MGKIQTGVVYFLVAVVIVGVICYGYFSLQKRSATAVHDESLREEVRTLSRLVEELHGDRSRPVQSGIPEDALRKEMQTLARQVSSLARDITTLKAQNSSGGTEAEEKQTINSNDIGESDAQKNAFSQFRLRHSSETRTEEWAAAAENAIANEFSTNELVAGVTLDEIDCRASLCRVSWQYPTGLSNEEAFILENEMLAAFSNAGFNASSQNELGGGGLSEGYFMHQPPPSSSKDAEQR